MLLSAELSESAALPIVAGLITLPLKCLCLNLHNLWIWYLTWWTDFADVVKVLEVGITLGYVGESNLVTWILKIWEVFWAEEGEWWRTDTLELWCWRRLESPMDHEDIKPVHPKGNQSWVFIGRTDAEDGAPIYFGHGYEWPTHGKYSDAGKSWRQEEKGTTEGEMVGWHHRLNGHEFEQTLGDSEGQGSLMCCSPWGWKEPDMTEQLNNKNINYIHICIMCM